MHISVNKSVSIPIEGGIPLTISLNIKCNCFLTWQKCHHHFLLCTVQASTCNGLTSYVCPIDLHLDRVIVYCYWIHDRLKRYRLQLQGVYWTLEYRGVDQICYDDGAIWWIKVEWMNIINADLVNNLVILNFDLAVYYLICKTGRTISGSQLVKKHVNQHIIGRQILTKLKELWTCLSFS